MTARLKRGVAHTYESSAVYQPLGKPGASADIGGCVNVMTNARSQIRGGNAMAPNACLVEIEAWRPKAATRHATAEPKVAAISGAK